MNSDTVNKSGLSAFVLKVIAIIAMTFNHIANVFGDTMPLYLRIPLFVVGGLTFPIMAYLMAEGYRRTSNIKKYMLRLFLFGLLALVPFFLTLGIRFNVLFTLLLGLICLYLYEHMKNRLLFWLCFTVIVLITLFCDWSIVGVTLLFAYGTVTGSRSRVVVPTIVACIAGLLYVLFTAWVEGGNIDSLLKGGFTLVWLGVIPLLLAYNGKRGYNPPALRYLFYIYYPAHLFVLAGIKWLIL